MRLRQTTQHNFGPLQRTLYSALIRVLVIDVLPHQIASVNDDPATAQVSVQTSHITCTSHAQVQVVVQASPGPHVTCSCMVVSTSCNISHPCCIVCVCSTHGSLGERCRELKRPRFTSNV